MNHEEFELRVGRLTAIGIFSLSQECFLYGCFLKWWYPQNTPKMIILSIGKPMVVGETHHFRNPPNMYTYISSSNQDPCSSSRSKQQPDRNLHILTPLLQASSSISAKLSGSAFLIQQTTKKINIAERNLQQQVVRSAKSGWSPFFLPGKILMNRLTLGRRC